MYPGNLTDTEGFSTSLPRLMQFLDDNHIARDSVTLVFDKGAAALANTHALDQSGVGWVSALPWNQAPPACRDMPLDQLTALSGDHPGVQAAHTTQTVHGRERACVLKYSASFLSEQVHSLSTSLATTTQALRRLSGDLAQPDCRLTETQTRTKITRRLATAPFLDVSIRYTLVHTAGRWRLQFDIDTAAFHRLLTERLGLTVLMTNRLDWSAEQVVAAYGGQQHVEQVFRGLKDGDWLGWGPICHWTDSKIRVNAFHCMLGVSLLHYVQSHARRVCPPITVDRLMAELAGVYDVVLLYPPQGQKEPPRTATAQSKQTFSQVLLAQALGRRALAPGGVGKTRRRS